jgi:Carboxypeptidase regulatory-like domain/TonB-dependent Receptor Plug Domain
VQITSFFRIVLFFVIIFGTVNFPLADDRVPPWQSSEVPVRDLDSLTVEVISKQEPKTFKSKGDTIASSRDTSNSVQLPLAGIKTAGADSSFADSTVAIKDSATALNPPFKASDSIHSASNISASAAGKAVVRGLVLNSEDGVPLADAQIIAKLDSVRYSARTDDDGLYRLVGLASGTWKVTVFRKGYESRIVDIEITAGEDRVLETKLERRTLRGQVIQARVERRAGSAQELLAKRQKVAGVMEGVSAEQIAKTTDSDAGAVARRLVGTSLVGGKYIYVRGLGERYTNMTLNGLPVPSPEKDKRVVPQDLFPAGALESFSIYKTFVPELYSDFAGGSVALVTKSMPEKSFFKVSMSTGNHYRSSMDTGDYLSAYREQAPKNGNFTKRDPGGWQVGNKRLKYDGGNTFWGFDDGTRSLPKGFPELIPKGLTAEQALKNKELGVAGYSPQERAALSQVLPNIYNLDTGRVTLPTNLSLSAGNVFSGVGGGKFGYLIHAGFKNKYDQSVIERQTITSTQAFTKDSVFHPVLGSVQEISTELYDTVRTDTGVQVNNVYILAPGIVAKTDQGSYEAQLSAMANLRYENEDWAIWWKNFAVNIGTDKAFRTYSYQAASGAGAAQDKVYEERYFLDFNRRFLYTGQLGGEAYVGKGLVDSLTWVAGLSTVVGETPDNRRYRFTQNSLDTGQALEYFNNDIWGTRIFEELSESALAGRLDAFLVIPPEFIARDTFFTEDGWFSHLALPSFTTGLSFNTKSRSFSATRYSYDKDRLISKDMTLEQIRDAKLLVPAIIGGFSDFATSPKDYDTYDASETQSAAYLAGNISARLLQIPFGLDGGVRLEYSIFHLLAPYTGLNSAQKDYKGSLREFSPMPTVGLWAQPYRPLKLRLQFAQTSVRPEFREVAPFDYNDFVSGRSQTGNINLKKTDVTHYDLRADWFLPFQQSFTAALFYKDFTDPVETIISTEKSESYQNAKGAYVKGVEFETNLSPGQFLESMGMQAPWLEGLRLSGNYALMESQVRLKNQNSSKQDNTNKQRPMVGQAPYLINLSAIHEYEGRSIGFLNALLFNVAGERIRNSGTARVPDIMEKPFPSLESLHRVTWFKRNELSVRVKNWLSSSKEFRVKEANDKLTYNSVTAEEFTEVFGNIQRYHIAERTQEPISVEITYSRQL